MAAHLEVKEEAVELLLAGAAVEVLSAGVQQGADQADAEQVLGGSSGLGEPSMFTPNEVKEKSVRKMTADSTIR